MEKRIGWEEAMNSSQALVPEKLDWDTVVEDVPLAVAGVTEFV